MALAKNLAAAVNTRSGKAGELYAVSGIEITGGAACASAGGPDTRTGDNDGCLSCQIQSHSIGLEGGVLEKGRRVCAEHGGTTAVRAKGGAADAGARSVLEKESLGCRCIEKRGAININMGIVPRECCQCRRPWQKRQRGVVERPPFSCISRPDLSGFTRPKRGGVYCNAQGKRTDHSQCEGTADSVVHDKTPVEA
ncbi:hypothetical protein [Stenotrophomonas cyclobalanopsidis]|uniref:hypothetical protein n=1 Tax=Stenotrophomonas cyclobalanopsidis TaxID=2771362 RepID=UPI001FEACCAD|nr:hypothetical protein [Stenotrophomonas cyclobalanopsidis]